MVELGFLPLSASKPNNAKVLSVLEVICAQLCNLLNLITAYWSQAPFHPANTYSGQLHCQESSYYDASRRIIDQPLKDRVQPYEAGAASTAFPLTDELPDTTCSGMLTKLLLHIPAVRLASKTNCNEQVCFCFPAAVPGVAGKVWCLCYRPVATRPLSPLVCWRFDANQSRLIDLSVEW